MIIPAMDLYEGKVVRLKQGDFNQQTQYQDCPLMLRDLYAQAGSSYLHLVDLSGARDCAQKQTALIKKIVKDSPIKIQVGGGIRCEQDLIDLFIAGANRVVIGSLALLQPSLVKDWIKKFGPERIVLALDVTIDPDGQKKLVTQGWLEESDRHFEHLCADYIAAGVRHVLCTDIKRDGMLEGANLELYKELPRLFPQILWQASGGVGSINDLESLKATGVTSIILGRSLLQKMFSLQEAIRCWQNV